jgi:hypothetical protein
MDSDSDQQLEAIKVHGDSDWHSLAASSSSFPQVQVIVSSFRLLINFKLWSAYWKNELCSSFHFHSHAVLHFGLSATVSLRVMLY